MEQMHSVGCQLLSWNSQNSKCFESFWKLNKEWKKQLLQKNIFAFSPWNLVSKKSKKIKETRMSHSREAISRNQSIDHRQHAKNSFDISMSNSKENWKSIVQWTAFVLDKNIAHADCCVHLIATERPLLSYGVVDGHDPLPCTPDVIQAGWITQKALTKTKSQSFQFFNSDSAFHFDFFFSN